MDRVAVIAIIIKENRSIAREVQQVLSDNADVIKGRMGIPDLENNLFMISAIVKCSMERISAITGKLGRMKNVTVKTAISDVS